MGAFTMTTWILRFFVFHLHESPKYLAGQGQYAQVVDTLDAIARYNGTTQPLTIQHLERVESSLSSGSDMTGPILSRKMQIQNTLSKLKPSNFKHVRGLFSTKKLAISFVLILSIWALIGIAAPLYANFLPLYLEAKGAELGNGSVYKTYRNNLIIVACSVPGTLVGGYLVDVRYVGRKGTLGGGLILAGIFLFAFTAARNEGQILAFNCISNFAQYM